MDSRIQVKTRDMRLTLSLFTKDQGHITLGPRSICAFAIGFSEEDGGELKDFRSSFSMWGVVRGCAFLGFWDFGLKETQGALVLHKN